MTNFTAQFMGFAGLFMAVVSFQKKYHKGILFYQVLACAFFIAHFIMLGAYSGAIMNFMAAARNAVFYHRDKSWASGKIWLPFFIASITIAGLVAWKNAYSLLPAAALIISTIGFWMKNPTHTRLISLIPSPCWFAYNLVSRSIAGMVTEIFIMTSLVVGIVRFDVMKKPERQQA
ncbi:MAG: YgjV family protein [Bacillota bacterium]